jgi:hypothetical protein
MTREEKQKAIDALKISAPIMAVTQEEFTDYIQTLNKIMDWLEQEPKTGHWIEYTRVLIPEPINRWEQAWYCSECGYGNQECEDGSAWLEWKHCPNCGAKMESEEQV